MDLNVNFLANAVFLGLVVFALVEFAKKLLPNMSPQATALVALIIGQAAVWGVAYSDWAHETELAGKTLDNVNAVSLVLVGVLVAAVAMVIYKTIEKAIPNIGENQP